MDNLIENVQGNSEMFDLNTSMSLDGIVNINNSVDDYGSLNIENNQEGCSKQLLGNNSVPFSNQSSNLGGMADADMWDFDINFDLVFGNNGVEQTGFAFDLNAPLLGTENGSPSNGDVVEVIDVPSDDSDSDVEIIGFNNGNVNQVDEMDVAMPFGMVDDEPNFVFPDFNMDNVVDDDPWVPAVPNFEPDLMFWPAIEAPVQIPVVPDLALRQAEQAQRRRRECARRFARINFEDENDGVESSSKKQVPALAEETMKLLENCSGPFYAALERIRARNLKVAAEKLIDWKPSMENRDNGIAVATVPSLLDMSLKCLAENAEGLVSLEHVPDFLRRRLVDLICDTGKMDVHILNLLLEGCPTEVRVKNCSWLGEKEFHQAFRSCQTNNLRVLQLDLCGQFMCDAALKNTFGSSCSNFSSLSILSVRGACRLSDSGIEQLVMSAPTLQSINLGNCTLLTHHSINFIASSLGSNLKELWIDDCSKINAMLILPFLKNCTCLEVLSVAGSETVTDEFISEMTSACGQNMKELDLANCPKLTDWSLKSIGGNCTGLCSLNISYLQSLTDLGMGYLANGCRSIQSFKLLRNGFSDEAMAAFLETSGAFLVELSLNYVTNVGPNTSLSLAKHSRKLLSLDVSWCRKLSNEALGLIVDSCLSLKLLKAFGCRQITSVFQNGYSNPSLRIIGLNMNSIFHHVNLHEPKEMLLRYSPLQMTMNS